MSDWVVMHIRIHNDLEEYLFLSILLFSILSIWIQKSTKIINGLLKVYKHINYISIKLLKHKIRMLEYFYGSILKIYYDRFQSIFSQKA